MFGRIYPVTDKFEEWFEDRPGSNPQLTAYPYFYGDARRGSPIGDYCQFSGVATEPN